MALQRHAILDTPADADFDALTSLAADLCQVPIALINLVDKERQWTKSKVGLCASETPRDHAFCAHAIHYDEPLIIRDATQDERTRDNPFVTGSPGIRFYAGMPLIDSKGFALGTLCVIDIEPRDLTPEQLRSLRSLARQVVSLIEHRTEARILDRLRATFTDKRHGIEWGAVVSLVIGLTITALVVYLSHRAQSDVAAQRFARLHESVKGEIGRRINLPEYGLKGLCGVFTSSVLVERDEFAACVGARNLPREFPGVLGIGFIKRVARGHVDRFVAAERADRAPDFAIQSTVSEMPLVDDLYVVKYINPIEPNRAIWGFDVGSEPKRRAAVERAARTGEAAITAPIVLRQEGLDRRGFLYILPVYKNGTNPQTPEARMAALDGLLFAPVAVGQVFAGVVDSVDNMLDLQVIDEESPDQAVTLYASDTPRPATTATETASSYSQSSPFTIAGRNWSVRTRSTAKFDATMVPVTSIVAGVLGSLLSVLLAVLIRTIGRSRAQAFALAQGMTADLNNAKNRAERTTAELRTQSSLLRIQSERLSRTNHMARVGGWEMDLATNALTWTDEVYYIHDLEPGAPIDVDRAIAFYAPGGRDHIQAAIENGILTGVAWDLELPLVTAKGREIWVRAQGECLKHDGVVHKLCGAFQDITDRKLAELQLRSLAWHDKLTGLPNRSLLSDRLQQCQNRTEREPGHAFAVLFLDFDRFKQTNDTLGHDAGDDLLKQIAARLRGTLCFDDSSRKKDFSTVGRLGGDEFVVVLDGITSLDDATAVADRLLGVLAEPYRIFGHQVVSTASIGIVTSGPDGARAEDLLRNADIAMYEAKLAGKGCYVVFDTAMHQRAKQRLDTETDLRHALEQHQLSLAFQPIVAMSTMRTVGMEALIRWEHPTRGIIPPELLIPIADETGLILPIGEWVLRQACQRFMAWQTALGELAPQGISVNLTRRQLMAEDLTERIRTALDDYGMPAECLNLEIREDVIMKDPAAAKAVLWSLRKLGVKIAMDGFGTGQSSLAMLHDLPIDVLKIDRSFTKNLGHGREFIAVVQAVAQLAHNLGVVVVAEGIETADQVVILQTIDCELGQGHLLGAPMSGESFSTSARRRATERLVLTDTESDAA
ncbi:MAG TPA: EAL domain-containing protein [Tepidisphaeraceae bacterium]